MVARKCEHLGSCSQVVGKAGKKANIWTGTKAQGFGFEWGGLCAVTCSRLEPTCCQIGSREKLGRGVSPRDTKTEVEWVVPQRHRDPLPPNHFAL